MPEPNKTNSQEDLAQSLLTNAEFDRAEKVFKQSLSSATATTLSALERCKALDGLAELYQLTGDYERALALLQESRKVKEAHYGIDHPEVAIALRRLGELENVLGNEPEAEKLASRGLFIWLEFLGYSDEQKARRREAQTEDINDLNALFGVHSNEGLPQLLYDALAAKRAALGSITAAQAMLEIGALFNARRLFKDGKPYYSLLLEKQADLDTEAQAEAFKQLALIEAHERNFHDAEQNELKHLALLKGRLADEHPTIVHTSLSLSRLCLHQGRTKDARQHAASAKEMLESSQADETPAYADALAVLSQISEAEDDLASAELLLKRSIELLKARFSEAHPLIIRRLNLLTRIYTKQKRFDEAESIYFRAIDVMSSATGPQPLVLSEFYSALANVYSVQGKFGKGESVLQKAIAIRQNLLVSNDLRIATTLSELGALYINFGKYQDAEGNLKRALAILENRAASGVQAPSSLDASDDEAKHLIFTRLAQCHLKQGRFAEAEKLSKKQLDALEQSHDAIAFPFVGCLKSIALANLFQFKIKNAQKVLTRAREIVDQTAKTFTPDAASLFLTIGDAHILAQNLSGAQEAYETALAGASAEVDGAQVIHTKAIRRLASTYELLGETAQSAQLLKEVWAEAEEKLVTDAEEKVRTFLQVGSYLLKNGDTAQAITLFKQAISICDLQIGPANPLAGLINVHIARWHAARQELRHASEFYMRATSILDGSLGATHWELIVPLTEFAMVSRADRLLKDAEMLLRRASQISEKTLGGSDSTTASVLALLLTVMIEQGSWDQKAVHEIQILDGRLKAIIAQASDAERARLSLVEHALAGNVQIQLPFWFNNPREILADTLSA